MKKVLTYVLSMVMVAALAIGGTLAYLRDEESDVNVMTMGNVDIEQLEYERVVDENGNPVEGVEGTDFDSNYGITQSYKLQEFTQAKPAYPAVYTNAKGTIAYDEFQQLWNQVGAPGSNELFDDSVKNVIDKFTFVKNVGKSDAYYRTLVLIEGPDGVDNEMIHINFTTNDRFDKLNDKGNLVGKITLDGVMYEIYNYTYNKVLTPGEVSRPSLLQVFLDPKATNEDCAAFGDTWDILVLSQAVQTAGFDSAEQALNEAFGAVTTENVAEWFEGTKVPAVVDKPEDINTALKEGGDVILTDDVKAPLSNGSIYGTPTAITQANGGTIDGAGNSLIIENPQYNGYAIETYGGTIKNLTIDTAVGRGIVISSPKEDIIIDNVVVDGPGYAINTTEHSAKNLVIKNSTVNGWTSLAGLNSILFENCKLGENTSKYWQGMGYSQDFDRLVRPYLSATFKNCEFEQGYYIDLSALAADGIITLDNCVVNGTKLTSGNYNGNITIELPSGRTLADCVVFK